MTRFYVFVTVLLAISGLQAQIICTSIPASRQFFARDNQDSSSIHIAGTVTEAGHSTITIAILKNGAPWKRDSSTLVYGINGAAFSFTKKLHAELAEYRSEILLDAVRAIVRDSMVCGDAYIVNGQSNAVCRAASSYSSEWIRTYSNSGGSACATDTLWDLAQAATQETHASVGVWPLQMARKIVETCSIPVCILNGAVGGTSISEHARNSSNKESLGTIYGCLLYRMKKAGLANQAKALFWYQGENNTDATALTYAGKFDTLYRAWKEDYPAIQKIYVCQIHHGCGWDYQGYLRDLLRRLPAQYADIRTMSTMGLPGHDGCHYAPEGYNQLGDNLSRLVARDFYGSADTADITPPDVKRVYFSNLGHTQIAVEFDRAVWWPADSLGASLKDYFYLDGMAGNIDSGKATGNTVTLHLKATSNATKLTYLPNMNYISGSVYEGPYLTNSRGIGALTFQDVPIELMTGVANSQKALPRPGLMASPNPFSPALAISFECEGSQQVAITVVDASGRIVISRIIGAQQGLNSKLLDFSNRPPGLYLVRARVNGRELTQRAVFLR